MQISKPLRTLDIYTRLCEGKIINKIEEANRFGVDERSIQRDIDNIRAFLSEKSSNDGLEKRELKYDRVKKGFVLTGYDESHMSNAEILAISKILLESRAFTKNEIDSILDKLISGCVPVNNMKLVADLISNEKYHYVELRGKSCIKDKLWEIGEEIRNQNVIEITYQKQINSTDVVKRIIQPVAIIFSEYYFYLNGYIVEKDTKNKYVRKYPYPAIFRLDRVLTYRELGETYRVEYVNRFEDGEFRKRIQFMFSGELIKVQFRFKGNSIDAILDRLPTAKILSKDSSGYIIEAEVFGQGILMWLLSQGTMVEILKPDSLRQKMKDILSQLMNIYMQ